MVDSLRDALSSVVLFLPKLLAFIAILVIGYLIAKALAKIVDELLERVGFDRAVERGGVKKMLAQSELDASSIVGKIVFYALMLFVLQMAFGVFGPNPVSDLLTAVIAFLPQLFVAIIIVVIAAAIATAVRELISNTLGGLSYGKTLGTIAAVFILGLGIIAALNQIGVATTVTTPILIAVLATIGGILVVGVGGGLIKPMQHRWEGYLETLSEESAKIREEVDQAPSVADQARAAANEFRSDGDERPYETDQTHAERPHQAGYGQPDAPVIHAPTPEEGPTANLPRVQQSDPRYPPPNQP
ncbi:hypothetical protein [Janibacter sp. GXQ6167]|uniref:mechanosensitive ion channel family protein n=1 Tax=Janibacter sp. GXQ6167 TaxID=3240791 RepID=UPI0035242EAC